MELYVFVGVFQGLVEEVQPYVSERDAELAWSEYTHMEYFEFQMDNELLDKKYEGTAIYVTKLRGKAGCP